MCEHILIIFKLLAIDFKSARVEIKILLRIGQPNSSPFSSINNLEETKAIGTFWASGRKKGYKGST